MKAMKFALSEFLLIHGGVEDKDLVKLVNNDPNNADDDDNDDEMDTMSYSPYYLPSRLPNNFINTKSFFGILSLNAGEPLSKV